MEKKKFNVYGFCIYARTYDEALYHYNLMVMTLTFYGL